MKRHLLLAGALIAAPSLAAAQVAVSGGWVRPPPPGAPTAAAYLTLVNRGRAPDRLLGGSSPDAGSVGVHSMSVAGGIMRMRKLDGLDLPPNAPVTLRPGGDHLMLTGLNRPLKSGDHARITLRFQHARPVTMALPVRAPPD